jgi:hypothetical protein
MLGGMPPLRERYAPKLARLGDRIRRAPQRVEVEKSQYRQQKMQTAVSIGATVLGRSSVASLAVSATSGARRSGRARPISRSSA